MTKTSYKLFQILLFVALLNSMEYIYFLVFVSQVLELILHPLLTHNIVVTYKVCDAGDSCYVNPQSPKLNNLNFHSLEVVPR